MSAGSVGGFRAREEAEKQKREQERAAAASRQAQQSEAGKEAHRQAVLEAYKRGKETPGAQTSTVRTDFTKDTASSTVKTQDSGRSSSRDRRQFSQSGDPVNLQGDKQAIQEVRARAFQQAREKAARSGTKVDEAAVNRETRNILAASGGNVSVVDRAAQKRAINEAYSDFKRDKSIPESDMAIMTPVRGIRSRSTYEGFFEGGGRTTVSIGAPKVTKEVVDLPPPPDNFFEGAKTNLQNLGVDLELGARGAGIGIGSLFSFANPNAQKNLIKDAEKQGRIAESKTGRELEREFVGSAIQTGVSAAQGKPSTEGFSSLGKDIVASPQFFAGSAATSAAIYLTPFGISKLIRTFGSAPKAVPRARFDFDPRFGSLYDAPSVRFGPYNPTRWENPEMLADLAKFKMSIDLPQGAKIAPLVTVRSAEAFERVRSRQDSVISTRGGDLVLKMESVPISRTKTEPIAKEIAKQAAKAAAPAPTTGNISRSLGLGGGGFAVGNVTLGLGGLTGAERRRRRTESVFTTEFETLRVPGSMSDVFKRNTFKDASSFMQSQRTSVSQFTGLTGKQDTRQSLNFNTLLQQAQLTATMQTPMTAQMTRQVTRQITGLTTRTTLRNMFDTTIPRIIVPIPPTLPFGKRQRTRKGRRSARGSAILREFKSPSPLRVLGTKSSFAKEFEKLFGKLY